MSGGVQLAAVLGLGPGPAAGPFSLAGVSKSEAMRELGGGSL